MCIAIFCVLFSKGKPKELKVVKQTALYTHAMLIEDIELLLELYPAELTCETIGFSVEGRKLFALCAKGSKAKYNVLIQASIHGREHMTSLIAMALLERLLYSGVPKEFCFHFLPMVNPDGVSISQLKSFDPALIEIYERDCKEGFIDDPLDAYLKKWKSNARGIDLNRNFDAGFSYIEGPQCPSYANFQGYGAFSEPESSALRDYTQAFEFSATVSYHAMGNEIYYEFGDNSPVNEAGFSLAKAVKEITGYKLVEDDGTSFGGYKDWAIEKMHIPSLTIEVGSTSTPLPEHEFLKIFNSNKDLPFILANWVSAYYKGRSSLN